MLDAIVKVLLGLLRLVGRIVLTFVALVWATLDLVLFPLFEPLVVLLSRLPLFQRLGGFVVGLPPGIVLSLFGIPFLMIQASRVVAFYLMATGSVVASLVLLIGAYIVSLFTVDRIYHTGREQMLKVRWFGPILTRIEERRENAKAKVRGLVRLGTS